MKKGLKRIIKDFVHLLTLPEMLILPGQLAFYILMSFIPILALCNIVISYFVSSFNLTNMIYSYLPNALADIIIPFISVNHSTNIWFLFVCYLFVSANGPRSIIITSNELYKIKNKSYLYVTLKSVLITIVLILLLIFIIFIPILGDTIINLLHEYFDISSYVSLFKFIKVFVSFIFIYFSIKILYSLAPSIVIKSKTTTIGALFTTISWIIVTEIFAFYITNIARYDLLYGNFSNILILLIWIYLISYLFVVGMAMNINSYHLQKQEEVEE